MSTRQPVRLALVGCNSSLLYVFGPHTFNTLKGGELVAVADINAERARRAHEELNAKRWYTDFDKVLEDGEVEALVIVTPGWCHEAQTVAAAKAGKHVLCEKPMAITVARACVPACNCSMSKFMTTRQPARWCWKAAARRS